MFSSTGTISGTYKVDNTGYTWDDSELLTRGVLKLTATGIGSISVGTLVNVYTTGGILIQKNIEYSHALDNLPLGIYIINGKKIIKK